MQNPVGVSLLAIAECQTTSMLNVTTPSRAGSLLQWICGESQICEQMQNNVGASLLAMGSSHSTLLSSDTPLSLESQLPQGFAYVPTSAIHRRSLWERACSRKVRYIQHYCRLTLRYRWQASSHRVLHPFQHPRFTADHCGSELAREGVVTFNITVV